MNEREEFEAWASKEGWSESDIKDRFAIDCPRGDEYRNFGLQDFWEVWQAARKLMEEELAALRKDADSLMAMCSLLEKCRREKERLTAELSAAKAKHYEECAVIVDMFAVGPASRWHIFTAEEAANAIRAALTDKPTQPLK